MAILLALLVLFAFVDVWYFVRFFYLMAKASTLRFMKTSLGVGRKHTLGDLLRPIVLRGMVLPSDIDFLMHMNNSKYLREMDFGRSKLYLESGLREETRKVRAATLVAAISIRYRRSLRLWQLFTLTTRLVYWNDNAFYLEQRFTGRDGFVHAIAFVKMVVRSESGRVSPGEVAKKVGREGGGDVESPSPSPELKDWIESLEKSSKSMKNERLSDLQKKNSQRGSLFS